MATSILLVELNFVYRHVCHIEYYRHKDSLLESVSII